jgi:hypothetical protein
MTDNLDKPFSSASPPLSKSASAASHFAIPGYDTLGCGFNAFDPQASELAQTAFRGALVQFQGPGGGDFMQLTAPYQKDVGGRWTVPAANPGGQEPLTGSVYQVPADVEVTYIGESIGGQGTFYTYQQIADYFSVQAGVEGGDGLFWGSANSTFSSESFESSSYFYGIYETLVQRWAINLDNALLDVPATTKGSQWDVTFTEDAMTLAAPFDPSNSRCVAAYRDFFTQYGTHVVAGVTVGARSRISVCIKRSTNISADDATLDIKAEYDGVTGSLNTKASYKNSNYEDNHSSSFLAMGGDQQLATLASDKPAVDAGGGQTNFEKWLASTDTDPAAIKVTLVGLWNLGLFKPGCRPPCRTHTNTSRCRTA